MLRTTALLTILALAAATSTTAVQARSVKDQLSDQTIASFCADAGVNTETTGTFTLLSGQSVTGSVHCEAEDMIGGTPVVTGVAGTTGGTGDDDDDGLEDDHGDDGAGHDEGDDHGGDDDHSGDSHGGDYD